MSFAEPLWLAAGAAAVVLLALFARRTRARRRAALARFVAAHLVDALTASVSDRRRTLKATLLVLGVAAAFVALARPQLGYHWEESKRRGIDVLFAIDVSRSMLVQDVKPDRLARAKLAVTDLLAKLGGDRVGLIAFAGTAFLQCPLTLDHDAFRESLMTLDPGVIPKGGTDVASALAEAEAALGTEKRNEKLLVLITDGEDLEGNALAAAQKAGAAGIKVFTVGVGTPAGDLIPVPDGKGGTQFVKDAHGQFVRSRLDEQTLARIAEATGGFSVPLGARGEGLDAVYERALAAIPKSELASRLRQVPRERFQFPLAFGILCLLIEMLLRDRKTSRTWSVRRRGAAAAIAATLLIAGRALGSPQSAERAYRDGDYARSAEEYRAAAERVPGDARLRFNQGAAAYKAGELEDAATAFQRALETDQRTLQEQAFYNLGNTRFRLGERTEQSDPERTAQAWRQALAAYEAALGIDPADADARHNLEVVKKRLERLEEQQKRQEQQKQREQQKPQEQQPDEDQKQQEAGAPQEQQQDQESNAAPKPQEQQGGDAAQAPSDAHQAPAENPPPAEAAKTAGDPSQGLQAGKQEQQAAAAEPRDGTAAGRAARAEGMTPEEAAALLDSLRTDERSLAVIAPRAPARGDDPARDW